MPLRHTNPTQPRTHENRHIWARAPDNFIPLPKRIVTAREPLSHDVYHETDEDGRPVVSGYVECRLETTSPTYIRGMLTEAHFREFGRAKADQLDVSQKEASAAFFSAGDTNAGRWPQPRLPGSSLRGMTRTLVEIVGYGRLRWVADAPTVTFRAVAFAKDDPLSSPYAAVIDGAVRAGYLQWQGGRWYVWPAKRPDAFGFSDKQGLITVSDETVRKAGIPGYVSLNDPDYRPQLHKVSFDTRRTESGARVSALGPVKDGHTHRGFLVCSGNMLETGQGGQSSPRDKLVIVPEPTRRRRLAIPEQVIRDYEAALTPFQRDALDDWDGSPGCLGNKKPVFYVADGDTVQCFGHCPNFRIPARPPGHDRAATPRDFLPSEHKGHTDPDLADAIFGWVEEEREGPPGQCAGRVFFEDGHFTGAKGNVWLADAPIAPHVLSEPKPTTFQHYLVQSAAQGHHPDDKASLAHYGTATDETELRGHKCYWHRGRTPDIEATASERAHETQLTRIVPLAPGVTFSFRVHFENLRHEELGALMWALSLPASDGVELRHKLGMGKPLGMGAAAIDTELYLTNRRHRYTHLFDGGDWEDGVEPADDEPFIQAMERYVLDAVAPGAQRLTDIKRIKMLQAMLQWRDGGGEWSEWSRYMEIEHGPEGINEYKERPVLPDPLDVARRHGSR